MPPSRTVFTTDSAQDFLMQDCSVIFLLLLPVNGPHSVSSLEIILQLGDALLHQLGWVRKESVHPDTSDFKEITKEYPHVASVFICLKKYKHN